MAWEAGPDLGIISASGMVDAANRSLARFRELHIPIPENSRLERARAIVEAANADFASAPPDRLAEAFRTIYEMRWIARALGSGTTRPPNRLTNALASMLSGPDIEAEDDSKTKPRSLQFELYVAAILAAGGVRVDYAEPDLRMYYLDDWVGIAVKLPRNRRRIAHHLEKAVEQIEKWTPRGMIALNVDGLLDEVAAEGVPWEQIASTVDQLPEVLEGLANLSTRPRVRGLLAVGTATHWSIGATSKPQLERLTFVKWNLLGHSEAEKQASEVFDREFQATFSKNASY